jgi:hypothetical protein
MASFRLFAGPELSLGTLLARRSRSSRTSAPGATDPRPRRDADDVILAVREGSGGRSRLTAQRTFLRTAAGRLPHGTVQASPPCTADHVVYEDRWGQPYRDL